MSPTKEALAAFKVSGLYDPALGTGYNAELTQFMNASNLGKVDINTGMPTKTQSGEQTLNFGDPTATKPLNANNMMETAQSEIYSTGSEDQNRTSGDKTLGGEVGSMTVPPTMAPKGFQNDTSKQEMIPNDFAASSNASQMGAEGMLGDSKDQFGSDNNTFSEINTSGKNNAMESAAQDQVNTSKQEIEIGYKQDKPTTLFGMAADKLDDSGFTNWSKEKAGQSFDYGKEQFGNMSLEDNQPMWNKGTPGGESGGVNWGGVKDLGGDVMSGLKGGAGMLGAAMGGVGGMLSGALGTLGQGLHTMGAGMSGQQQPRYGQGQQRFPQARYSNFGR